jgi:hypothetical protein
MSPWECMYTEPSAPLLDIFTPLTGLMLLCSSIDRLLAVAKPLTYFQVTFSKKDFCFNNFQLGVSYAKTICGLFYAAGFLNGVMLMLFSWYAPRTPLISALCDVSFMRLFSKQILPLQGAASLGSNETVQLYFFLVKIVTGSASVALYLLVPVLYHNYIGIKDNGKVRNNSFQLHFITSSRSQLRVDDNCKHSRVLWSQWDGMHCLRLCSLFVRIQVVHYLLPIRSRV